MTPERWQRVKEVFEAASWRDPAARSEFLDQACVHDPEVKKEVESLLRAHDADSGFMKTPVGALLLNETPLLRVGQRFGYYEQIAPIAKGGMGQVYSAVDTRLGRKIALKLLPASLKHQIDRVRRFEQEARAASALNHPNIVTIHEIGELDSLQFIATEFVDGVTLRDHMTKDPMAVAAVLDVAGQVASALQAAHEAGIVHRDIKPENIMLRRDGIVKVLDFGLAKLAPDEVAAVHSQAPTQPMVHTNPGMVMGTVGYMSPEQARGAEVDSRTDIWSLGVVIYEMISGRPPFVGETPSHIIVSICEHEPPPLSMDSAVPDELQHIVTKALTKDRKHRYENVKDLLSDIRSLKQRLEVDAVLERTTEPGETKDDAIVTKIHKRVVTDDITVANSTFSKLLKAFKSRRQTFAILSVVVMVGILASIAYWRFQRRTNTNSIRSIAVLPFENQTHNADSDYLSDGISEALINKLSQLPGVTVTARSASFLYKDKGVDPQEVANTLGVEAILTGRVLQRGDNITISVELMNAQNRTQVWGEQYSRKLSDLLVIQSDISGEIVRRLRVHLSAGQEQQLAKKETLNLQAYELYLKGRSTWINGKTADRTKAVEYYQQAIGLDPDFSLAHAALSLAYNTLITNNEVSQKEFGPMRDMAARKAVQIDENLPDAHLAMAWVKMSSWDWGAAESELKRAIELSPNFVAAHRAYATLLMVHGKREEAVAELNRVTELDPFTANQTMDVNLSLFRRNQEGLELAKKTLESNKQSPGAMFRVAEYNERLGNYQDAVAGYQEAIKLGDDSPDAQMALAEAYARNGEIEKAKAILKRYESGNEYCSPVSLATVYLALGQRDRAFEALEAAYSAHDQQLMWLRGAWQFDEIHDDPRFQDLASRVGVLP